jgi:putative membrane protein
LSWRVRFELRFLAHTDSRAHHHGVEMLRITLAVLHLLALGIGLGAVYARARALHKVDSTNGSLARAFAADNWWPVAALLWISTGLWRVFAATEKTTSYYWTNHIFLAKMGFLLAIIALEIWPTVTLIRWRKATATQTLPPSAQLGATARRIARISDVQTLLVIAMIVAAVMMARGYGAR